MIKIDVYKTSEEDVYSEGCISMSKYGTIHTIKCKNMVDAIEEVKAYGEPYLFDDRLEVQVTETSEGNKPTINQYEEWKQGKIKLYAVNYSFYFYEVTTRRIENAELKTNYPTLEEN